MSFTLIDKLQEHVCIAIRYAPDYIIEDYKQNFLKMPVEVSCLDFFHPSHRENWVNPQRYCDFVRQKTFWSGDHFISGMPTRRFWKSIRAQREQRETYPMWRAAQIDRVMAAAAPPPQDAEAPPPQDAEAPPPQDAEAPPPQDAEQVIVISSDDDEESKQKEKDARTIVISSDSDEPLIIIPRKRKTGQSSRRTGESSKARRTKYQTIFIGDREVIELDSDEDSEMTVVG